MAYPTITTLISDFQSIYPLDRRIRLTNPGKPDSTTEDTAVTTKAAEQAALYFEMFTLVTYDDTKEIHRTMTMTGMIAMLYVYGGKVAQSSNESFPFFRELCELFRDSNMEQFKTNSQSLNTKPESREDHFTSADWKNIIPTGGTNLIK